MTFDLRFAIGFLFLACGLVLLLHGLIVGTPVLGLNINLLWGGVLILFGALMTYLGRPTK